MRIDLTIYKRKVYIPRDYKQFPDKGTLPAYIVKDAILLLPKEMTAEQIIEELELIKKSLEVGTGE